MSELTYAQHAVWFTEQAGAGGDAYRMALTIEFGPRLDPVRLREACEVVLRRHPVLSTAVAVTDGVPQLVETLAPVVVTDQLDDTPFDLSRGPLTRLALSERTLRLCAHHLVFDGESKNIFVRELAAAYNGEQLGPPPPSQDAIVTAQRAQIEALLPEARSLWQPSPAPDPVLPGLRGCASVIHSGRSHQIAVPAVLSSRIGPVSDKLGIARFELLLTAWHLLLGRYGNEGLPVTASLSTRAAETRDTIGLFVNDLPLPVAEPAGTVAEYAAALRARLRELYRFRPVPFAHAVGSPIRPAPALTPVSVSYRLQANQPQFDGVEAVVDWSPPSSAARNLLHLLAVDAPDGLRLSLQHSPSVVDAEAVARIGSHLITVLEFLLDDPHQQAATLPLLPAEERDLLVTAWNDTAKVYPQTTVPERFAHHASQRPTAIAVVDGADRVSYAALDAASASIAAALAERGAGPGTRVAVCLPRSWKAVAALLGVMRAGAAYVPIDPAYPAMRREHILADADPVLVLDSAVAEEFLRMPAISAAAASPNDLAYVIYTSGSTGRPKGVAVRHSALSNQICALGDVVGDSAGARWLGLTSLSFDISVLELFLPLTTGATLVIAPDAVDGPAVNALIAAENVTHVQATPSGWRVLLDSGTPSCEVALSGGEALPEPLATELLGHAGKLINVYGPTEATIYSTVDRVLPGEVTIGRPLANTTAHILDAAGQPVPIGLSGELLLGGAGLADGYLGQPDLTAQRFILTPFGRLYRTGDLCSWLPDGRLRYRGRMDDQLKIRGHRVEPAEIAARLLEHPQVTEAAVTMRDEHLVGYVVASGTVEPSELRRHTSEALPSAMVPTHWMLLDRMPRTPNGKLDRAALPAPALPREPAEAEQVVDDLTAALTEIWCEVLAVPQISPDDDLFDLGGHSLSITRISSRIQQRIGVGVPLDIFFDTPTIADVAAYIRSA